MKTILYPNINYNSYLFKCLILSLLIINVPSINAQDYHVSKNGDDDNPGTASSPWESIQHSMDNATPGGTVYIHEGIYNEALYVNVSGTEDNYITFSAFEDDEVIVDAEGQTSTAVIEIYNVHHIAIENIIIRNHQRNDAVGILIEGACDHIRIDNCEIYNINFSIDPNASITDQTNAHAIAVYGDNADHTITDLEILRNKIHDCRLGFSEALVVNGNIDGFVINGNEVYDVTNIGIDIIGHEGTCDDPAKDQARNGTISQNVTYNCLSPYATSAGIYVDGGKNLIIERNQVYNNQWGIEIGCENVGKSTDNIIVRNNIIYGNSTAGLAIGGYDYPSGSGKVTNVRIINNTLYGNDTENDYTGELYLSYTENLDVFNNIIFGTSTTSYILSTEDLTPSINLNLSNNNWFTMNGLGQEEFYFDGNDYKGITEFHAATGIAANSLNSNPQFVSLGNDPDFNLTIESAMLDKGRASTEVGEVDFAGKDRVIGNIDIGAFEFNEPLAISSSTMDKSLVYPNPTSDYIFSKNSKISKIWNSSGEILYINQNKISESIDVRNWSSGMYFVELEDKEVFSIMIK